MKRIFRFFGSIIAVIIFLIIVFLIITCAWHQISSIVFKQSLPTPGDKIEIYEKEYIHAAKMGDGKYTIVFLPGMGTASPYYDYYKLAEQVSKDNQVIIVEPLGYGFSSNTDKIRSLDFYEKELEDVLNHYNVKENIILLGHSYSGISNLNYANKHSEVKGLVCLDCTTAYQIETHVDNGEFKEEVPETSLIYQLASPLGLSRFYFNFIASKDVDNNLLSDVREEDKEAYKYFLYNKTLNKTIINEINQIPYNQLELLHEKYNDKLNVLTILSDQTIDEMEQYKNEGDFNQDWQEMHELLISNPNIQKIHVLNGDHYIHHGNVEEITELINNMISSIK